MCFAFGFPRATDGEPLFANQGKYLHRIDRIMEALEERYGDAVDVIIKNSWGFFTFRDVVKLKITPRIPTWVIGSRKIYEGVPDVKVLCGAIDAELEHAVSER
jgi:hypothetical protein